MATQKQVFYKNNLTEELVIVSRVTCHEMISMKSKPNKKTHIYSIATVKAYVLLSHKISSGSIAKLLAKAHLATNSVKMLYFVTPMV